MKYLLFSNFIWNTCIFLQSFEVNITFSIIYIHAILIDFFYALW